MPTYEYVCRACGHAFEQFQSITSSPVRTCPKCGKRKVERKIGIGAGVLFRGGGFYETDYRSESYSTAEKAERESGTKSDGASGDAKAKDTKPAGNAKAAGSGSAAGDAKSAGDAKGAKAEAAPPKGSSDGSAPAKSESGTKADGASKPRKSHAREGRGIGNILALGRAGKAKPRSKPRGKRR